MVLAIFGIVVLLYILLAYFAAKTWQVWHVVLLVFLFIFSSVFMFLAAATLKVQQRWRSQYVTAQKDLDRERENNQLLTMGSVGGAEPGEVQLRGEVKRMLVDRGRVWRNLRLADLGDGQVILDSSTWSESGCVAAAGQDANDDPELDEDASPAETTAVAEPTSLGLDADAVVYAFKEAPLGAFGEAIQQALTAVASSDEDNQASGQSTEDLQLCKVPSFYVGEFRVVGEANNAVTLTPTMPLSEPQIEQLQDPNTTWVLYEVMPVDGHEVFAGMSAEQISALISPGSLDAEVYRMVIDSYVRDLQPGTDMDPPERKWTTIKFTQPDTIEVDVEVSADEGEQPLSDSLFDPSGRSLVATLNQGETTQFEEGDVATFDFATAQELINQEGKAVEVESIFHRRLRDYGRTFRGLTADLDELDLQMGLAETDLQKLNDSVEQLKTQLAFQEQQRTKFQGDLDGLTNEREILGQYLGMVEQKWQELRTDLSRLYRSNRQLVNRMTSVR